MNGSGIPWCLSALSTKRGDRRSMTTVMPWFDITHTCDILLLFRPSVVDVVAAAFFSYYWSSSLVRSVPLWNPHDVFKESRSRRRRQWDPALKRCFSQRVWLQLTVSHFYNHTLIQNPLIARTPNRAASFFILGMTTRLHNNGCVVFKERNSLMNVIPSLASVHKSINLVFLHHPRKN